MSKKITKNSEEVSVARYEASLNPCLISLIKAYNQDNSMSDEVYISTDIEYCCNKNILVDCANNIPIPGNTTESCNACSTNTYHYCDCPPGDIWACCGGFMC